MERGEHLKLVLVGDVMLGRLVNDVLRYEPPEYPWGDTLPIFQKADWRACNLECVISDRGTPWSRTPKTFHFRSDARNIAVLKAARINVVSLANNHTLDFDHRAMFDMLALLDRAGIAHSGAGANLAEASRVAINEVGGAKIGLLSFTDNQPEWEAGPNQPGVFYVPVEWEDERIENLLESVHAARDRVDLLVVAAHWGLNWGYIPPPQHVALARKLIQAGADLIFSHSPHVCRGIEISYGRPVLYSTGNFIDDYAVDENERNDHSFIFVVETDGTRPRRLTLRPTLIRDFQARLAVGAEAAEIAARMAELCAQFDTETSSNAENHSLEIDLPDPAIEAGAPVTAPTPATAS